MIKKSPRGFVWGAIAVALLVTALLLAPRIQSFRVGSALSPDGLYEAVLLEVPKDAAGAHSYKVCLQRPRDYPSTPANCREVAYLAGVPKTDAPESVSLIWTAPSHLEIDYLNAKSVHVYSAAIVWGSRSMGRLPIRSGVAIPISIRAVQLPAGTGASTQ
jgi:hypothetical protein